MSGWFESWHGFTLLDPWLLLFWLLIPLALGVRRWRGSPAVRFAPGEFLRHGSWPSSWRVRLWWLPRGLYILGLVLAVVALARPVQRVPLPLKPEGIDILLCLDISSSMTARDMDPQRTRLDVTKDAAAQFITGRPNDRIGLIGFARYPDVHGPLTLDHEALKTFLADMTTVNPESPEDATGIGTAVARAAQVLRGSQARSKVVILFTDGEENVATAQTPEEIAPLHAGQLCKDLGVRVYTITAGIASPRRLGDPIPLDTSQVRRLAEKTDGQYFEARDANAVAGVYAYINELETIEFEEPRTTLEERFLPFLIAAVALLLASRLLESTVLEVLP